MHKVDEKAVGRLNVGTHRKKMLALKLPLAVSTVLLYKLSTIQLLSFL